jgi:hypothetical protein
MRGLATKGWRQATVPAFSRAIISARTWNFVSARLSTDWCEPGLTVFLLLF